jgi:hypothetical protein
MGLDTLLTGTQAARLVGVTRQLVYGWWRLGHLTRISGRYRAGDVLAVEAEMRGRSGRPIRTAG